MKRLAVLVLAMVLAIGLNSVAWAFENGTVEITAFNEIYGAVLLDDEGVINLSFSGAAGDTDEGSLDLRIESNAYLDVGMEVRPLRNWLGDRIATGAQLSQKGLVFRGWRPSVGYFPVIDCSVPDVSGQSDDYFMNPVYDVYGILNGHVRPMSGRGMRFYRLGVNGKLGAISDQAGGYWGDYRGEVIITLAAPSWN